MGIVWHREGFDLPTLPGKGLMGINQSDQTLGPLGYATATKGAGSHEDGGPRFTRQPEHAPDMIGMFMRDEDSGQITGLQTQPGEPSNGLAHTESAIDQQRSTATGTGCTGAGATRICPDQKTITLTAAAQAGEPHQSLQRKTLGSAQGVAQDTGNLAHDPAVGF